MTTKNDSVRFRYEMYFKIRMYVSKTIYAIGLRIYGSNYDCSYLNIFNTPVPAVSDLV